MQGSPIRYYIALTAFLISASGCVTTKHLTPQVRDKIVNLRKIAIVAIEAPPLMLHPSSDTDRAAMSATGLTPPSPSGGGIAYVPLPIFLCPLCPMAQISLELAASSAPVRGESVIVTRVSPPPWMPTLGLATLAERYLKQAGKREAFVINGYGQLPIKDRSVTVLGENWMAPVRRYYNSEVSPLDYTDVGEPQADAILEVGVSNYEYFSELLLLQVTVKLIDPLTKQVLGSARNAAHPKGGALSGMLSDQGEPLRKLIETTGETLLLQCLQDLALIPR